MFSEKSVNQDCKWVRPQDACFVLSPAEATTSVETPLWWNTIMQLHHHKDISIVTAKIRLFKTFSSLCFSSSVCSSCLDLEKKALYTSNSLFFLFLFHFLPSHLPQSSTYHSDKWSNNKVSHLTPCILLKNHPNYCVMGPQREKSLGEIYPEGTGIVHLSIL